MAALVRSSDGTSLAVSERGSGAPVVCVHGASSAAADWAGLARTLREEHRVVTYDRRGRGGSGDGASYDPQLEVEDLRAVLAHVGEPVHLVAHSYGAWLSLQAAPSLDLLSLALYEPPLAPHRNLEERAGLADAAAAEDWDEVLRLIQPAAGMTPEEIAFCQGIPAVVEVQRDAARTVAREVAALDARPLDLAPLRAVEVPALVLLGELTDAPVYLDGLPALQEALRADVVRIPGQRHIAMAADPRGFAAALRAFWAG